ncbi:putative nuclease, contains PIN domain, potential toxin-antitoxin system component [Cyclonatronum proteinivorum]|uniref:Putative nuclease, contains PIN domain, potential toxin-antitoxin system component n=1 Tax=Cyclonatronum proteinivorum TaxID=1457365 RepID=A0A345UH04_9BACT|nr:DUF5615 family PIN-like protein [Cyclonatronum proteinivorum]AXI99755.1 putative nuclease, contains PIN domain, potential toxin-antitoxin system component [Cyclonatronum proteinivorum]
MKLLIDQNLSHRLKEHLKDLFTGSMHVKDYGMEDEDDSTIWEFARQNGFTIVSKDSDFHQRSFVMGHPPKVIWIKKGNCSTETIISILRLHQQEIRAFGMDQEGSLLVLE